MASSISAPLAGLRVLEFGHYIAGPLAGVFLGDQGADVIRVARPGAPVWDPTAERTLARGKRSITADLTDDEQRAQVLALAAEADVVLENFRPGVMDRLGLGYSAVAAINPAVIFVSMPGYSRDDPRAGERGYDSTISAGCGLFTDLSVAGAGLGLPPTYTPLPLPSVYAGLWGAIGAVAALHARQKTGCGDWIEAPLADAAMSAAAGVIFGVDGQPARYNAPPLPRSVLDRISLQRAPRVIAQAAHRFVGSAMPPFFTNYTCADGELLFICAIDNANQIAKLIEATGISAEVDALGFRDADVLDIPASKDNINAYRGTTRRWIALRKLLATRFATDTADAWAERLARAGVPAVRQRTTAEWSREQVMHDSGVLLADGDDVQPAPQVDVCGNGVATPRPAPTADAQADSWPEPRTFAAPEPAEEHRGRRPAPLDGVRVLDLANVIAGPAAGRTLAELGAEVTHVSAVAPRMGPRMTLLLGLEVNQGKRSIALDAQSDGGGRVLARMLPGADVVLYNKLPAQAERLGVSPAQVHAVNPRAVVTAVTAYSGVHDGGWEDRPAYDPVIQAYTGIMRRFGGASAPAVHGIASCIDYFTGFAAAYGTIVGLVARQRGRTHIVSRTSLVRTAAWVQLPFIGRASGAEVSGLDARGPHAHDQLYKVRDGWIQLVAPVGCRNGTAPAALSEHLGALDVRGAIVWARSRDWTAVEVRDVRDLRKQATVGTTRGVVVVAHPAGERLWLTEPTWLRSLGTERPQLAAAPRPGEHTRELLRELGVSDVEIDALVRTDAVSHGWDTGPRYVPG